MPNAPLTLSMITGKALSVLKNKLTVARYVNRSYDKSFGVSGAKIGTVLNVRNPVQYDLSEGPVISTINDFVEDSVPLTLNRQPVIAMQFGSAELLLSIDDFSDRVLSPAIAKLANEIDRTICKLTNPCPSFVGTPLVIPNTSNTYLAAGAKLDKQLCPRDGNRYVVLDPDAQATIVPALQGLLVPGNVIGEQYSSGQMGKALGFQFDMDQNVVGHTVGALGGTPAVGATSALSGSTIVLSGVTASVVGYFKDGDKITFAASYGVNGQSKVSTGNLKQFSVVGDTDSASDSTVTITINPPIYGPGSPKQNVDALPSAGDLVSVLGLAQASQSTIANKVMPFMPAFHKDAITLACADLPLPGGVDMAQRASDEDLGLSLRIIRQYNIMTDQYICRVDILFGCQLLRPEFMTVVLSGAA